MKKETIEHIEEAITQINRRLKNIKQGQYYLYHGLDGVHCIGLNDNGEFTFYETLWNAFRFTNRNQAERVMNELRIKGSTVVFVKRCDDEYRDHLQLAKGVLQQIHFEAKENNK